jgi:hypothetical protein
MADRDVVVLGSTLTDAEQYAAKHQLTGAVLLAAGDIPATGRVAQLHVTDAGRTAAGSKETFDALLKQQARR